MAGIDGPYRDFNQMIYPIRGIYCLTFKLGNFQNETKNVLTLSGTSPGFYMSSVEVL